MRIAIGTDHAGFLLKDEVMAVVQELGHEAIDLGTYDQEPVDYPDYAEKVGLLVYQGDVDRGILLCGSGVGVCIAANKISGVYACVCHDTYTARQGVEHDHMNVLCLGGRVIGQDLAKEIVKSFLLAIPSKEERHLRRINKIIGLEKQK